MTFAAFEGSVDGGRPVELYEFVIGAESFKLASTERDVTIGPNTYEGSEARRSSVVIGPEARSQTLSITVAATNPFVRKYINTPPGQKATLNVLRFHPNDPDLETRLIYKGVVRTVGFDLLGERATVINLPITEAQSRQGPRFNFGSACSHVVYDARCKANSSLFRFEGVVSGVSGRNVTVTGLNTKGDGWATSGYVSLGGVDFRTITGHTGDVITLMQPFPQGTPDIGTIVEVFAGCDRSLETCATKFDNVLNFHGYRFVPLRNPFSQGIRT